MDRFDAKNRKREAVSTLAELAGELGVPEARRPKRQDLSKNDFDEFCALLESAGGSDAQRCTLRAAGQIMRT